MAAGTCEMLSAVVGGLREANVEFALVHESALMGWGIDNSAFLNCVDVLLLDDAGFGKLGVEPPREIGAHVEASLGGALVRFWSRESIGLNGPVEVTACARYGCEALAPEVTLRKLAYSPEFRLLAEQRARLAAILRVDELSDEELALVARYVRGD